MAALPEPADLGIVVAQSTCGGDEGLLTTRSFLPGDEVFVEAQLARLEGMRALETKDKLGLKESFDALAMQDKGDRLTQLCNSQLFRGSSDGSGEERRSAHRAWAKDTWPTASVEEQMKLADAMTILSYNAYCSSPGPIWVEITVIYTMLSKANHSCLANVSVMAPEEGTGKLVCLVPLSKGDEVFSSYLCDSELLRPIGQRRELLRDGWDFECMCPRCIAPVDDTRRFSCGSLSGPLPQWTENAEACDESRESSLCVGTCLAEAGSAMLKVCSDCKRAPDEEGARAWLEREKEAETLFESLPEGLYAAWAKLEDFACAHPYHGLSGRWNRLLSQHLDRQADKETDSAEAEEMRQEAAEHRRSYRRCLAMLLPQRGPGGVLAPRSEIEENVAVPEIS